MQISSLLAPLAGGALIGLSASLFLLFHGKIAGISGLFGGLLQGKAPDHADRLAFVMGLGLAGVAISALYPAAFASAAPVPLPLVLLAGLLVGFGTRLGNGCTSGHGVCGLSRLSIRSLVATVTFMATGALTVLVSRHVLGGGQ